jgi:hypothetical protein
MPSQYIDKTPTRQEQIDFGFTEPSQADGFQNKMIRRKERTGPANIAVNAYFSPAEDRYTDQTPDESPAHRNQLIASQSSSLRKERKDFIISGPQTNRKAFLHFQNPMVLQ